LVNLLLSLTKQSIIVVADVVAEEEGSLQGQELWLQEQELWLPLVREIS